MRLIDVDKFQDWLYKLVEQVALSFERVRTVVDILGIQLAAYEADKVLEQLEELVSCEESRAVEYDEAGKSDLVHIYEVKAEAYRNTIETVKSGSV